MFGALQRGESVTSISGALVHPAQVLEGGAPGAALALMDTPSLDHLGAAVVRAREGGVWGSGWGW